MSAKIRSVSAVSGILITVGLLGTVIGLIITVGGISQVLDAAGQDYEAMIGGLNVTVQGMGSAFYTTFFGGLLGGVILRALYTETATATARLAADCLKLGELWIVPLSQQARSITASELAEELIETKRVMRGFSEAIGEVGGVVLSARDQLESVTAGCVQEAERSLQEMVEQSVRELREGLSGLAQAVAQTQAPLCAQLEELQTALMARSEAFGESHIRLLEAHMQGLEEGVRALVKVVESAREPLGGEIERWQQQFVELADKTEARHAELIARNAAELQESLAALLGAVEEAKIPLSEEIRALEAGVAQAAKASEEAARSLRQIRSESLDEQTGLLRERLQAAVQILENMPSSSDRIIPMDSARSE